MIEIHQLKKVYGKKIALDLDDLQINAHDAIGLVGNNGAGKTTMLSLILDLIQANKGYVTSKSQRVAGNDDWKNYTAAYLNEGFLVPFLSSIEFLEFVGNLHQKNKVDVKLFLEENIAFFDYKEHGNKYIRELSAGNKNKVGILAAMLPQPEVLLLDEPFSNLDPSSQARLLEMLKQLHQKGTLMIISSHDLKHVTEVCNRIILLESGKLLMDIATNEQTLSELEAYFRK